MRNNYAMPEAFELGRTRDVMLGSKPAMGVDAILGPGWQEQLCPDDIDESDD